MPAADSYMVNDYSTSTRSSNSPEGVLVVKVRGPLRRIPIRQFWTAWVIDFSTRSLIINIIEVFM